MPQSAATGRPRTPDHRRLGTLTHFSQEIGHARRVRPSRGPRAPHIVGGHPVDNIPASGTTSWPSWPTVAVPSSQRPRVAGHVWPAGGSGSAATRSPAVPAPQVGCWATPCSGTPSSWPRQTRGSGFHARGASEPSSPRRSKCHSCEARRGCQAPHRPEYAAARTCTARRRAITRQLPRAFRSTVTLLVERDAGRAEIGEVPRRSALRISST